MNGDSTSGSLRAVLVLYMRRYVYDERVMDYEPGVYDDSAGRCDACKCKCVWYAR